MSPLRKGGVYRFRDRDYTVVPLSTAGKPWRSTGLIHWPPDAGGPLDIVYLRHDDGLVISSLDWQTVGTRADLEDTGRTEEEDGCQH